MPLLIAQRVPGPGTNSPTGWWQEPQCSHGHADDSFYEQRLLTNRSWNIMRPPLNGGGGRLVTTHLNLEVEIETRRKAKCAGCVDGANRLLIPNVVLQVDLLRQSVCWATVSGGRRHLSAARQSRTWTTSAAPIRGESAVPVSVAVTGVYSDGGRWRSRQANAGQTLLNFWALRGGVLGFRTTQAILGLISNVLVRRNWRGQHGNTPSPASAASPGSA